MRMRLLAPVGRSRILVAIVAAVGFGCSDERATPVASEEVQEIEADNVIYGMTSFLTREGIREARITADTAFMFADSATAQLRVMEIVFYDEEGAPRATVTATEGVWGQRSDRLIARGDVHLIVHADGREIRTEELNYEVNQDRIWSDTPTTQTLRDGTTTRGTRFESDLSFERVRIENVRGGSRPIA